MISGFYEDGVDPALAIKRGAFPLGEFFVRFRVSISNGE
jgi:hypothetical protein